MMVSPGAKRRGILLDVTSRNSGNSENPFENPKLTTDQEAARVSSMPRRGGWLASVRPSSDPHLNEMSRSDGFRPLHPPPLSRFHSIVSLNWCSTPSSVAHLGGSHNHITGGGGYNVTSKSSSL